MTHDQPSDPVQAIAELFASEGLADYLGEDVTQAVHMLQTAALAERDGADDALVAAALLHDVGHFTGTVSGQELMAGRTTGTASRARPGWPGGRPRSPSRSGCTSTPSGTCAPRSRATWRCCRRPAVHPGRPGRPAAGR